MTEHECPEVMTIQAVADGEENESMISGHLRSCSSCRQTYQDLKDLVSAVDRFAGTERLPSCFYENIISASTGKPLPAALVAAASFLILIISAFLLNPGYLQWWFSKGITLQIGFYLDLFFDLIIISRAVAPLWWVLVLIAVVALEVLVLINLKTMEGYENVC